MARPSGDVLGRRVQNPLPRGDLVSILALGKLLRSPAFTSRSRALSQVAYHRDLRPMRDYCCNNI